MSEEVEMIQDVQPETKPKTGPLRVGIVGSNTLALATDVAFNTKSTERKIVADAMDVDELIEWKPSIAFVCLDISLLENDTLDDADFLNVVSKLVKQSDSGICIRSTLNIETIQRLMMALGPDVFNGKVIYMPEVSDSYNLGEILSPDYSLVGGAEKTLPAFLRIIRHTSHFSAQTIVTGSIFEVAYAKLSLAGFKAVKQTFFNQMYDTILDCKNANPAIVRRMIEKAPDLTDRATLIPTFIRSQVDNEVSYKQARGYAGEYLNSDVRMLVGMTDKLPILDECVNFKNLKD